MDILVGRECMEIGRKTDGKLYNFYCVDDSAFMLKTLIRMLDEFKVNVIGHNVKSMEALEYIREHKEEIDVVTLDINMPEMNGLEMLPKIKEINPKIKVIIVSAIGETEKVKETIKMGASHFIVKPFNKNNAYPILKYVCTS